MLSACHVPIECGITACFQSSSSVALPLAPRRLSVGTPEDWLCACACVRIGQWSLLRVHSSTVLLKNGYTCPVGVRRRRDLTAFLGARRRVNRSRTLIVLMAEIRESFCLSEVQSILGHSVISLWKRWLWKELSIGSILLRNTRGPQNLHRFRYIEAKFSFSCTRINRGSECCDFTFGATYACQAEIREHRKGSDVFKNLPRRQLVVICASIKTSCLTLSRNVQVGKLSYLIFAPCDERV